MRDICDTDEAMYIGGSIRDGLKQGDILFSDCVNAFPFGNDILVVRLKGKYILEVLEFGARMLPEANNGLIHVSGMEYTVDLSVPSSVNTDSRGVFVSTEGPYRVRDVVINGMPLDPEKDYTIATNAYLQEGGDGMSMMDHAEIVRYAQMADYELFADYIENGLGGIVPESYQKPGERMKVIAPQQ